MRLSGTRVLAGVALALAAVGGAAAAHAQEGDAPVPTRPVMVRAQPPGDTDPPVVVDRLAPATVLTVQADGFEPNTTARVAQCVDGAGCTNHHSARFDDDGYAAFQYLITDDVGGSGDCRLDAPRCTIELRAGEDLAVIDTVFVDAAPAPGTIAVEPSDELTVGDLVTVTASEFAPGAELTVMVCAAPSASGSRCGAPGPEVSLPIETAGSATTEITVPAEVGADAVACGRRSRCQVVVASDDVGVWARPATLDFAAGPSPGYSGGRVLVGIAAAIALLALAGWLISSTDWRPPPEADASPIDDAEYADLDREAEAFPEPADGEDQLVHP